MAIKNTLRYQVIVTKQRIKKGVLLTWVIGVYLTIQEIVLAVTVKETKLYSVYWTVGSVSATIIGLVCISGICYCYVYIFSEIKRQKKRLQTEQLSQEEVKRVKKDNKAAYTLGIILGSLVINYMPEIIFLLVGANSSFNKLDTGTTLICFGWASTSVLLRSLFHPIIYCWRNEDIRHAFLEIFHLRQNANRAPNIQMVEIQHRRPEIQHSFRETWPTAERKQEPVLLSIRHTSSIEEMGT